MNQSRNQNNDLNGTRTSGKGAPSSMVSVDEQRRLSRNKATARIKWTKEMNIVAKKCFYRSEPFDENGLPIRGYGQ